MKKIFFILLYLIFFLGNTSTLASNRTVDLFNPKKQTPNAMLIDNMSKPEIFEKNNNLTRKTGSFKVAVGEPLFIEGVVTDAFGVPIGGAIIKIWQTNAAGKYHSLLSKDSEYVDPNFSMSGESITNNLGEYGFITIFPGFYKDRAPHINMMIIHEKFGKIETEMYFDYHPKNKWDPYYSAYNNEDQKMLTAKIKYVNPANPKQGKIAILNITMEGVHQYKGF